MTYYFIIPIFLLAFIYYLFHKSKSTILSILIFGILIYFIIEYLVNSNIATGAGIGLFGIMSIIRFKETFENPVDIIYLFISISISLLAVFINDSFLFSTIVIVIFMILILLEKFLKNVNSCRLILDIDAQLDVSEFEEKMNVKVISHRLFKVDMYKLSKIYIIYYSEK